MTWTIILIVLFVTVVAYVNFSRYYRLIDKGQIIKRPANFEEKAEIFTLCNASWERVLEELRTADYHRAASGSADAQHPLMVYKGAGWGAELYKMETDAGEKDSYYFHFTNWDTMNGVNPQSEKMNTLLTTIEKVFLKIDPQTQVSTEDIKVKHRPKFF